MRYPIAIEVGNEQEAYGVVVPDLPGCFSAGWVWAVVQVDPARLDDKIERVNITLPRRVLAILDAAAREAGETRSGYIARLALTA